jgi:phosphatidylinositol-3-phosphatase
MNEREPVTWRRRLTRPQLLAGLTIVVLLAALLVAMAGPFASAAPADSGANGSDHANFKHVFVIMMENTGIEALLNNPNAPWINQAILVNGVGGNYYGVTHPSQPNYIAATSGATNGVANDNDTTISVPNIVDQLEARGKTWKAYMQSLSLCDGNLLAHACGNQLYERKHNPFVSYQDVQSNPARMANIVDFSQFATDLANDMVPDYSWISPDQCHDMHGRGGGGPSDSCDFSQVQSLIATGDSFLSSTVGAIMSSKAWTGNSVIFITWDESDFTGSGFQGFGDDRGCCDSVAGQGGGHVLTLVITREGGARASFTPYNHFSMLATIENGWKLGCLANTCDTDNVTPMSDLVG